MEIYNHETNLKNLKKMEEAKKLNEEYIQLHTPRLKAEAMPHVITREVSRLTTAEIGEMIGAAENVIKNFEKGEQIDRSKLVSQSYATALNLIYSKKFGITTDNFSKLYSPIDLLEIFVNMNGNLGISLIEDAVNNANRLYKSNWVLKMDEFSTKPVNEKMMAVYDEDCGNYFYIIPKSS